MSDNVWIALAIAVALVCVITVFALRGRLRSGSIKVSKDGINGKVETHAQPSGARRNKFDGKRNKINAYHDGSQIDDNEIKGDDNQINIGKR